jgi:1-acyl-sn-glycerol-3-phosphate acyltransferase
MKKIILIIIYSVFWRNFLKIFIGLSYINNKSLKNKKQFILIANHNSHMDTMAIMSAMPSKYIHKVHPIAAVDFFWRKYC